MKIVIISAATIWAILVASMFCFWAWIAGLILHALIPTFVMPMLVYLGLIGFVSVGWLLVILVLIIWGI